MSVTMHATPYLLPKDPRWQRQVRRRLAVGYLLAMLLIAVVLALLRFPIAQVIRPGHEILIRLIPQIIEPLAELPADVVEETVEERAPLTGEAVAEELPNDFADAPGAKGFSATMQDPPDWYEQIGPAAQAAADTMEHVAAVNPGLDEKRRRAAVQFYASLAPEKKETWDNVETDQLGRKILWSGDCYRIIDDPNPATYDLWREFQQYFIYCRFGDSDPKMLPWVDVIRDRYLYLQFQDGEIPAEELRTYVER